jgi:hypothetical protein
VMPTNENPNSYAFFLITWVKVTPRSSCQNHVAQGIILRYMLGC